MKPATQRLVTSLRSMRARFWLVATLVIVSASAGAMLALMQQKPVIDVCVAGPDFEACVLARAGSVASEMGTREAIAYVQARVARGLDFKVAHLAMHMVGASAYQKTSDLRSAVALLPFTESINDVNVLFLSGFWHGVFGEFFTLHESNMTVEELHKAACGEFFEDESPNSSGASVLYSRRECFHAIGHGLMLINENDISKTLLQCDKLPREWMQDWCYHGVFMEDHYLRYSYYRPDLPRNNELSVERYMDLCFSLDEKYRPRCSEFVGPNFIIAHPGEYREMFALCNQFEREAAESCVYYISKSGLPKYFTSDFNGLRDACMLAGDSMMQRACLLAVADGVRLGYAGAAQRHKDFCAVVPEDIREDCGRRIKHIDEYLLK